MTLRFLKYQNGTYLKNKIIKRLIKMLIKRLVLLTTGKLTQE